MLSRLRSSRLLRVALALVALGFLAYGLARNWNESVRALTTLSVWTVAGSVAAVFAGAGLMLLAWRVVLAGLGSPLPARVAAKVMFMGQLGKYVPGSVWAFAAMAELARDHGSPPRRTFGATVVALVTSLGCALALAAATLPFTSGHVARQAWYLLALIPLIAAGLHPRVLTFGLNLVLRIARREPLDRVLTGRAMLAAAAWTMAGWLVYGIHIWLLIGDMRPAGPSLYAVAAGAYALAWATGLLTVIVPAGIGVREGAMVLVLAPVLDAPRALVVAVVSRLAFTLVDLLWAGIGFALARAQAPEGSKAEAYAAQ
ncbi:lysylphosphatidylglycerol synthase domain-containing protein [Sphaerisporangium sp. TRM90804]|uniref:lysylphosphatidylglycerol synthase transmembrane domain-containing protein n=1 Tax=Sphaerisporangium sp. TRM90804 TaxID=3031113 RepID=UPI002448EFBD|nr:lysylphosphatidylglycerol synthase domain-containing protein [Sphaerisporangium sp. TRM90804]MDH2427821.1 lysylphosphatidylglycerol synthase domain-containing protein [Sphaerisporangium sp. TRM90804]